MGLSRVHWRNVGRIRKIFRDAFTQAGLPYFNPHSFRNSLAQLGEKMCSTPEQFKAWNQNFGHEKVLTTFLSYGEVGYQRQGEIIRGSNHQKITFSWMTVKSSMPCSEDCESLVMVVE